ncbi:MAG TPA: amidohydrolase family protein [Polyangia bacterium]|nr:amidohydrolase family protein [Polyangia bacterium]
MSNICAAMAAHGTSMPANKVTELFLARLKDHNCDILIQQMNAAGIGRAVLLLADFTCALPGGSLTIAEMFEHHRDILRRHPDRLEVFAGVDPRWGRDGLDLFARGVTEYGFKGFKAYPPCGYSPSDPRLFPYYEICAARRLPVLVHTGGTSPALDFEPAHPLQIDIAAKAFPRVPFILAHGGVVHTEDSLMMCMFRPNVYIDVSGFQTGATHRIAALFGRGVDHKLLFGTDWPLFRLRGSQADAVRGLSDALATLVPDKTTRDAFFFGNTGRILGNIAESTVAPAEARLP